MICPDLACSTVIFRLGCKLLVPDESKQEERH